MMVTVNDLFSAPVSKGGADDLENLDPLQWENNERKSGTWPGWKCPELAKRIPGKL
jgi:hypothetical protein